MLLPHLVRPFCVPFPTLTHRVLCVPAPFLFCRVRFSQCFGEKDADEEFSEGMCACGVVTGSAATPHPQSCAASLKQPTSCLRLSSMRRANSSPQATRVAVLWCSSEQSPKYVGGLLCLWGLCIGGLTRCALGVVFATDEQQRRRQRSRQKAQYLRISVLHGVPVA